tara:strand:- start:54 stop:500 length:447 start_codon:yes stop_codon:yes gene_type:complete
MNGDNIMQWAGLWDESEFNFFRTLEDEDKLMYIYDLCLGEFGEEYLSDQEELDLMNRMDDALKSMGEEMKNHIEPDESEIRSTISVVVDGDILTIEGPTLAMILKVASDMQMNGLLITDKDVEFTKYEPWNVIVNYKIIGSGAPFSLN